MAGFQILAFAVDAVPPLGDGGRDGVEEHETRKTNNTTTQSRRVSGMVSSSNATARLYRSSCAEVNSEGRNGWCYALTPGAGAHRL